MKKRNVLIVGLLAATLAVIAASCSKAVEEQYRFTDGDGIIMNIEDQSSVDAFFTLTENTFTGSGDGVNISYKGVYTTGGGTFEWEGGTLTWVYLYASKGKIGFVMTAKDEESGEEVRMVAFGKSGCNATVERFVGFGMTANTAGMQDDHNGYAYWRNYK